MLRWFLLWVATGVFSLIVFVLSQPYVFERVMAQDDRIDVGAGISFEFKRGDRFGFSSVTTNNVRQVLCTVTPLSGGTRTYSPPDSGEKSEMKVNDHAWFSGLAVIRCDGSVALLKPSMYTRRDLVDGLLIGGVIANAACLLILGTQSYRRIRHPGTVPPTFGRAGR